MSSSQPKIIILDLSKRLEDLNYQALCKVSVDSGSGTG